MLTALHNLYRGNKVRALDYQFARLMHQIDPSPAVALVAAVVSYELGKGNVCLELSRLASNPLFDLDRRSSNSLLSLAGINGHSIESVLSGSAVMSDGTKNTPLVLDNGRLYLYRNWQNECMVAQHINHQTGIEIDDALVRNTLDRLFQRNYSLLFENLDPAKSDEVLKASLIKWLDIELTDSILWTDCFDLIRNAASASDLTNLDDLIPQHTCLNWQKVAAALAARQPFSVISGGPGTGKTTTVTRLLAMLVELGLAKNKVAPTIKLVAPTGKASARLTESIGDALADLKCSDRVRALIPTQAGTIHRLLGVIPNRPEFRHNKGNPLHLDILVVDEASMIDLTLMRKLLESLPDHARIILLGDRDQLSSVDAGSVLGDICKAADGGYSGEQTIDLENLTGFNLKPFESHNPYSVQNRFCLLRKSYRFDAQSGIGHLAAAVNQGDSHQLKTIWQKSFNDIQLFSVDETDYQNMLKSCANGYKKYLEAISKGENDRTVIKIFNQFRLLCALREGRFGVEGLNEEIRTVLARKHLIPSEGLWYTGRPVLITENAHGLGLYNGDVGIALTAEDGRLRVVFEVADGSLKSILPSRLPHHQTVFAMTIHKSQGSEFAHTVMVLPDKMVPVLTRELVYTGITRAKKKLEIYAADNILMSSIQSPTQRSSGLSDRLRTGNTV